LDASWDLDNDGLSNVEEYQAGADPRQADTDGDGIPDGSDPDYINALTPVLDPIFNYLASE